MTGPAARLAANSTVAGEDRFVSLASILENQRPLDNYWVFLSPGVTDAELDQRVALNHFLLGESREMFEASQKRTFQTGSGASWGPWTRDPADSRRRIANRLAAFDDVVRDPEPTLDRLRVRYVGLRPDQPVPPYLTHHNWTQLEAGPSWQVWERSASPGR